MKTHGSPLHPGSSGDGDEGMEELVYETDNVDFDEDDMIELTDDMELGNMADDEEDEDIGMEGFQGQQPDHILTSHLESAVFCCAFNSAGDRLLTGGEDDIANVWDTTSVKDQSPITVCRGFKDSVVSVAFSPNSEYFSTCDLSGIVKVWKSDDQTKVIDFQTGEVAWSQWHSVLNVLFIGCDDGIINMYEIPSEKYKAFIGSSTKCECGVLLPDGKKLLAGYADGTLKLFDLRSGETQQNFTKSFTHPSQVLCVAAHKTRQIVASGSADGTVALLNSETGKLFKKFEVCSPKVESDADSEEASETDSVEGLAFYQDPVFDYLVCGSIGGNVVVWDLVKMTQRMTFRQEAGLTKILWGYNAPVLYTAGLDGVVRLIDSRTSTIEKVFGRHRTEILDISLSKDGKKLVSASEDGTVYVYNLIPAVVPLQLLPTNS